MFSLTLRQEQHINFIPIEQIRPVKKESENFGRRTYQFSNINLLDGGIPQPKLKRVLSNLNPAKRSSVSSAANHEEQIPPKLEVDARLPDPAILTSSEKLPLRLFIKRLDEGTLPLYLQTLQVELVGNTKVRAGQVVRSEATSWVVTSRSNINEFLEFPEAERTLQTNGSASSSRAKLDEQVDRKNSQYSLADEKPTSEAPGTDRKGSDASFAGSSILTSPIDEKAPALPLRPKQQPQRQIKLDATPWEQPVPQTIPPTFKTCNIERSYALEVRVGIGYGAHSAKNQIILPLRLDCEVWSGIAPPKSLIAAMESRPNRPPKKPVQKKPLSAEAAANVAKYQAQASAEAEGSSAYAPLPPGEEEPPPSYEDAMGDNLGPVDGPRNYQPPPAPAGGEGFIRDDHKRRDS